MTKRERGGTILANKDRADRAFAIAEVQTPAVGSLNLRWHARFCAKPQRARSFFFFLCSESCWVIASISLVLGLGSLPQQGEQGPTIAFVCLVASSKASIQHAAHKPLPPPPVVAPGRALPRPPRGGLPARRRGEEADRHPLPGPAHDRRGGRRGHQDLPVLRHPAHGQGRRRRGHAVWPDDLQQGPLHRRGANGGKSRRLGSFAVVPRKLIICFVRFHHMST